MVPNETLYERKCRTLFCWDEVGEKKIENVELIEAILEKIKVIRDRLKVTQDRQKSYVDTWRRVIKFEVRDMVFLKAAPWKGVI